MTDLEYEEIMSALADDNRLYVSAEELRKLKEDPEYSDFEALLKLLGMNAGFCGMYKGKWVYVK